jgi:hypothetical protein
MNENEEAIEVIHCFIPECEGVMEWIGSGHICVCTCCGHEEIL